MQTILNQHPQVYASSTSPLLEYQFAARSNQNLPEVKSQDSKLMMDAFVSMCRGMADGYYKAITDSPVVCDKNRGWAHYFEWVHQWETNPKMFCMVRDPRAIIWSFEKVYRKNRHLPTGPDNPAEMACMTFEQRAEYWLNSQPLGLALLRMQDCIERGVDGFIAYVRYEDLLESPQETMTGLQGFLGLDQHDHDFDNLEKPVTENSDAFGVFGNHSVAKQLDASKVDDWRDNIPVNVADLIAARTAPYMTKFNYTR